MRLIKKETPLRMLPTYPFAHLAKTNFDTQIGWTNPCSSYRKYLNYSAITEKEVVSYDVCIELIEALSSFLAYLTLDYEKNFISSPWALRRLWSLHI